MPPLNAGLVLSRGSARDLVRQVREAEQRGLTQVWSTVGGLTADPVTAYAAAGAATERVAMGTAVVPTYPRHPAVLAAQAIAITHLAPDRLRLGVGPSHKPTIEGSLGLPMGRPLDHLREYVAILHGLLWDGAVDVAGDYFTVKAALPGNVAPPRTPVPVSALGPKAFRLAGEVADGAISWLAPVDYLVGTALPALQAGADAAGRARPPLIAHVPVAASTDPEAVRAVFRARFPVYAKLPFYAAMFAGAGYPVTDRGEMSDALIADLVVSGTPDAIRSRLEAIQARGIDELMVMPVPIADEATEVAAISEMLAAG